MATKGGEIKACAACNYQRRTCSAECPLSRYFPADQPGRFENAHRLFGIVNIMNTLHHVHPEEKDDAMECIIFESDVRAMHPVHGCVGIIWHYYYLALKLEEELRFIKERIDICKKQLLRGLTSTNQQEMDIPVDYDYNDSQSYIECNEPCESSAESSFKEAAQYTKNVSRRV